MPKGIVIIPRVEEIIVEVYDRHPELRYKPTKFHQKVLERVHKEIDWAPPNWPGLSVIKNRLVKWRKKDEERIKKFGDLDKPWSISTLRRHPISCEALPTVLYAWFAAKTLEDTLTIREAQWLDRLYPLAKAVAERVKDKALAGGVKVEEVLGFFLQRKAQLCTAQERVAELMGTETEPWPALDLAMWEYMTGVQAPAETVGKILPKEGRLSVTEQGWQLKITKEELASWQDAWQKLGMAEPLDLEDFGQLGLSVEVCEDIKAKSPKRKGGKK